MGNLQVWEGMDLETLDEQDKEVRAATSNEFWKPEVGENPVRFLPKLKGWKSHAKIIYEHFIDDAADPDRSIRFVCPRNTTKGEQRCPVCEQADKLKRSRSPVDHDRAKEMYPQMRVYTNIIDREAPEMGPRIYPFGKTVWNALKKIAKSKHGGGDYTNPGPNGFDVIIDREGTSKNDTRYAVRAARSDSELTVEVDQLERWLAGQWALDYYATLLPAEDLMKLLRGEKISNRSKLADTDGGNRRALSEGKRPRSTAQDDVEDGATVIDVGDADADTGEPPL